MRGDGWVKRQTGGAGEEFIIVPNPKVRQGYPFLGSGIADEVIIVPWGRGTLVVVEEEAFAAVQDVDFSIVGHEREHGIDQRRLATR
jgi:hypothetical protein